MFKNIFRLTELDVRLQNEVTVEGETGKVYRASFHDRHGRTVLILRPGKQVIGLNLNKNQKLFSY